MNKQILATLVVLALATSVIAMRPAFIQVSRPIMKHTREIPHTHSTDILSKFHSMMNFVQTSQIDRDDIVITTDEAVGDFVQGLRSNVLREAREHSEIRAQQVEACAAEGPFRQNEIDAAQQSLVNAKAQQANCAANRASSQSILTVNRLAHAKYNVDLSTGQAERARQNALYNDHAFHYEVIISGADYAIEIINRIAVSTQADVTSFAQLGNKITSLLMVAMRTGHAGLVAPIATMLVQAKQVINPEDVDQFRNLVVALRDAVQESQVEADTVEDQRAAAFAARAVAIEALIEKLEDNKDELVNHLVELERCEENESNVAIAAQNKYTRNTDLLAKAQGLCNSYQSQWEAAEVSRRNQLRMIDALEIAVNEVRVLFPQKFASLASALNTAVDQLSGPQADFDTLQANYDHAQQHGAVEGALKEVVLA